MNYQLYTPVVFLSAEHPDQSQEENEKSTYLLSSILEDQGFFYKQVDGCWQGAPETSFMVAAAGDDELSELLKISQQFNQDWILYRNEHSEAFLVSSIVYEEEKLFKKLGVMVQAHRDIALAQESYTYDRENNTYYIVR